MSLPLELTLCSTKEGPRLAWLPVKELQTLRDKSVRAADVELGPEDKNPLATISGDALEVRVEFSPGDATEVKFTLRGVPIVYDVKKQEVDVNGHRAAAPLRDGKVELIVYVNRTSIELFAGGGLTYVPFPVIPKSNERGVALSIKGDFVRFHRLEAYSLKSIWEKSTKGPP